MPVTIDGTTGISGNGSGLTDLNASNLSTGTVPDARFPATLPAVSGANLTALNASNLGSGTVPDARFPATLPAASGANLTNLNASNLSTGTVPDARFPATLPAVSGANLTNLNASNLSTGTVGTARLGSGTANSTTFLRGDGTWQAVSTTPTTAQVLSATAGANVGDVGSYAQLIPIYFGNQAFNSSLAAANNPGATLAGSNLRYTASLGGGGATTPTPAGTWRVMGRSWIPAGIYGDSMSPSPTVFLRIS